MPNKVIRKLFINDPIFNPFSDKCSYEKALEKVEKILKKPPIDKEINREDIDEVFKLIDTLHLIPFFNSWHSDYYNHTSEQLKKIPYSIIEIINFQLAIHNRNIIGVLKMTQNDYENKKFNSFEQSYGHTVQTIDPNVKADSRTIMETAVDSMNIILNYYRYFIDSKTESNSPKFTDVLNFCYNTDIRTQIFNIIRSEFYEFTWARGYISYDDKNKIFRFKWIDHNRIINQQIGFFRLNRNILNHHFIYIESLNKDQVFKKFNIDNFSKKRKGTKIKRIWVVNNYIHYDLENSFDELEFDMYLRAYSEVATYYNFLENVSLPNSPNLKIMDFFEMYISLRYLFNKLESEVNNNNEVFSFNDIKKFPTKIKEKVLLDYLLHRSPFTEKQILFFIEKIVHSDLKKRINLWDKFFVKSNDDLFFSLLPVSSSLYIYCLDTWIEQCGIDLDFRGKLFETYLNRFVKHTLNNKKFTFSIPRQQKLTLNNGKYEEIDLLINLKNKVIIAELKCVKYPMNHIDYFNAEKRLSNGADQIIRKKNFLLQNKKELEPIIGIISGKEVIPIVITNCPIFTCQMNNGIVVVDYFLFEAYFSNGSLGKDKIVSQGIDILEIVRMNEIVFYTNEDEFGNNFLEKMTNPPACLELKKLVSVKEFPLTFPKDFGYKIFVTGAEFKYE